MMNKLFTRYWILPLSGILGVYIGLPLMAPWLMHVGLTGIARIIYSFYSWQCHQLPQRSYFFFGPQLTYRLSVIQAAWQNTTNPAILRQFIGNPELGWKVAWSDRMVSMYTSLWLVGLLWWPLRRRLKALPWWGLVLSLLPMAVDGSSHFISDLSGIGQGLRADNLWLAQLTRHVFAQTFYAGDAWGSFNSLMRLVSGILFGIGMVWFAYPYLDKAFGPQPDHRVVSSDQLSFRQ